MKHASSLLSFCFLIMTFPGCAPKGIPVEPVSGSVSYKGRAVEGAIVSFRSETPDRRGASAITDEQGNFVLVSQGAKTAGAMEGSYRVLVQKPVAVDASGRELSPEEVDKMSRMPRQINLLPEKYAREELSDLEAVVGKGKNHFDFELLE